MRIVRSLIIAAAAMGAAGAFAGVASAQDTFQPWQVKVGVSEVQPSEKSSIGTIGGEVNISNEFVPTIQVEYFFNNNVSVELLCCTARHDVHAEGTSLGTVNLGKISHFPPTVTLKYHWTEFGNFQPYFGGGINYTHFFDDSLPAGGPVSSIKYSDSWGAALQAGFDYRLDKHWSLNADVRKIWISTDVKLTAGAATIPATVDINPYVFTLGTGYRF